MTLEGCFVGLFRDLKTNLIIFWKEKEYLLKKPMLGDVS